MAELTATRDAYGQALAELGGENPNVVVLDADLSKSTKTAEFGKKYPDRFFNIGIAEANMVGMAAGLALTGKIPFVSTFAIFGTGRAYDQVRNAVCYPHLNVKLALSHAGVTLGEDGASHQMLEDLALMRALPNMTVVVPADATETKQAVRALAAMDGPAYLRLGRPPVPVLFGDSYRFQIGKAPKLRDGKDVAILACGVLVGEAMQAAEQLEKEGVSALVLNVSTIKPLDEEAVVAAARQCGCVVTAEEHNVMGGMGSAVAEALARRLPTPMRFIGTQDTFGESGRPDELLEKYGLKSHHIAAAAREVMKLKR
ncbi:MAG: transketolase family protein [Bacillota bacterium]